MKLPELSRRAWLILGIGGVLVRLFLWWFTIGTNDVTFGFKLAPAFASQGIVETYRQEPAVNQPPFIILWEAQAWWLTGDDLAMFARLLKIPGLLGDLVALWALWQYGGPRAFAAYAWLPAAILVSGFHGNTDCLYAALILLSAIAFDREQYLVSGLLMAAACNVKVLPAVLAPLLLVAAPNRRALLRVAAGLAAGVLLYVPLVLTAGDVLFRNIIGYNSNPEHWGILLLLKRAAAIPALQGIGRSLWNWYRADGRYILAASILALGWLSRTRWRLRMTDQLAIGGALFLVLAPGFSVQYVVLVAPLLCLVDLRAGILWGWISGAFLASVYWVFMVEWWPARAFFTTLFPYPTWLVGLAAWGLLVLFLWRRITSALSAPPPARSDPARAC